MKRSFVLAVLSILSVVAIVPVAGATTKPKPVKPHLTIHVGKATLSDGGGGVTVRATTTGITKCSWTSVPTVKKFDTNVRCSAALSRVVHIPANKTSKSRAYTLIIKGFIGKKSIIAATSIVEAKYVKPTTAVTTVATTAPTSTTTTTVPTTTSTTTGSTDLAVHLDPTFVQNASNPLAVTYTASATASESVGLALAQLPQGVLDFYSDGSLVCSNNVGGNTTTTTCAVTYTALGQHTVVTEYISGTNSASETDVEQISGQSTTTTVALSGDPSTGATASTLTASISSSLGVDSAVAIGAITFLINNATTLITTQANQTSCTLNWSPGPTFVQGDTAYQASASSSDCTVTGTLLNNVSTLSYSASFAGALGLSASQSGVSTISDWPQAPAPITSYVTGDPYDIAISQTTIGNCDFSLGYGYIQFCLNAPTLTLVDANSGQTEGTSTNYSWLTTSLADVNGNPFTPTTGIDCGTFESQYDQCPLGDNNQSSSVPNPVVVTFNVSSPSGITVDSTVASWDGNQETTTITTHALVGSVSVQTLST